MKAYDLAELAIRNLRESVLRNTLTTVGISVGVASLVAMLSLGIGLQQMATRRLVKSGLFDTIVVTSRRDLRNFNRDEEQNGPAPAESPALDEPSRQKIEQLANVTEAFPDLRFITSFTYETKPHLTMVAGIPASYRTNDAFEGMHGATTHQPRADGNFQAVIRILGRSYQADCAVETVGGMNVDGAHVANAIGGNAGNAQASFKRHGVPRYTYHSEFTRQKTMLP